MQLKKLFDKPKVISVSADVNNGKSMFLYWLLDGLQKEHKFNVYTYGLHANIKQAQTVYSVGEIEGIRNSIIIIDELASLFDLNDRKQKRIIESFLRLINHNNNVLILCGVPENFKKFLAAKVDVAIYKKCTISDFINGSRLKRILTNYKGSELGSELFNIDIGQALLFDGQHYHHLITPYIKKYDTKKDNPTILQPKRTEKRSKKRLKSVPRNGQTKKCGETYQ